MTPSNLPSRQQLERELDQARRDGRWLADDERAALAEEQLMQRQQRGKLWLLTAFCVLIPPLWPVALVLVLYQLFPRTTRRYGTVAALVLLVGGAVLVVTVVVVVIAVLMALF